MVLYWWYHLIKMITQKKDSFLIGFAVVLL